MIRNGFYSYGSKALDGVDGGDSGVMVLRDGGILGGTSFFYFVGTYSCSGGRWKGEMTHQEHKLPNRTTRWRAGSSRPGLPERIPTRVPNSKPRRSSAREACATTQACGCFSEIEQAIGSFVMVKGDSALPNDTLVTFRSQCSIFSPPV